MLLVADLMTKKPETLAPDDDVDLADLLMRLDRCRHLPVVDRDGRLLGLVTRSDLLRNQIAGASDADIRRANLKTQVAAIMSRDLVTTMPSKAAYRAGELLEANKFGCLPVVENGKLVGILTEGDFLRWAIKGLGQDDVDTMDTEL